MGASLDLQRQVAAGTDAVRRALLDALTGAGFALDPSPGPGIVARRGSAMRSVYGGDAPVRCTVALVGQGSRAQVHVHLESDAGMRLAPGGVGEVYGPVFWEIQQRLDAALAGLDPAAPATWPAADFRVEAQGMAAGWTPGRRRRSGSFGGRMQGLTTGAPTTVELVAPDGRARLEPDDAQTHLAVASVVAGSPGALPDHLARDLEEATLALARALAAPTPPVTRVDVGARQKPAWAFVHQQVLLRARLPLRELQRCRECRFEKVVNPDYTKIVQRNKRWESITGLGGVMVTPTGQANLFLMANRVLNLRNLTPDWVCPRCQGLGCDVTPATICPGCGQIRKEPVLRRCPVPECGFAFVDLLDHPPPLWQALPLPGAPAGPGPGQRPLPGTSAAAVGPGPGPAAGAEVVHPSPQGAPGVPPPGATAYPPRPGAPAQPRAVPVRPVPVQQPVVPVQQPVPVQPVAQHVLPPAPPDVPPPPVAPAAWYPDPHGRHPLRWFDGAAWSAWVSDGARTGQDPYG